MAYSYLVAVTAHQEYSEEVAMLAKAEFDAVWMMMIELDEDFRKRVINKETQVPIGEKKPYIDYAKGKSSEL